MEVKKSIIAVAVTSVLASPVFAQSSVTLYGALDEALEYVNNVGGKSMIRMADGTYDGMMGSRWGLRGTEDLGDGLSAVFVLESGFTVESGHSMQMGAISNTGGRLFGRQAFVGLSSTHLGTLTMGRQYDPSVDMFQGVASNGNLGSLMVHGNDIDNTANSFRVDNSLKYRSPTVNGVTAEFMTSFTNSTAPGRGNIGYLGGGLSYAVGSFSGAAFFSYVKDPAELLDSCLYQGNGNCSNLYAGAPDIGVGGEFSFIGSQPRGQQTFGIGGKYDFGSALVGADYSNVQFSGINNELTANSQVTFQTGEVYGRYIFTPAWSVGAAYAYTWANVHYLNQSMHDQRVSVTTTYSLSKATSLYAVAALDQMGGAATNGTIFIAGTAAPSTTNRQLAVRAGILHKF